MDLINSGSIVKPLLIDKVFLNYFDNVNAMLGLTIDEYLKNYHEFSVETLIDIQMQIRELKNYMLKFLDSVEAVSFPPKPKVIYEYR